MKIMFICTGNICRSAMAQWLLKQKLDDKEIKNVEVYSCGVYAQDGDIPTWEAKRVMMDEYSIDMNKHRATNIVNSNIKEIVTDKNANPKFYYHDIKEINDIRNIKNKELLHAIPQQKLSKMLFEESPSIDNSISQKSKSVKNDTAINKQFMLNNNDYSHYYQKWKDKFKPSETNSNMLPEKHYNKLLDIGVDKNLIDYIGTNDIYNGYGKDRAYKTVTEYENIAKRNLEISEKDKQQEEKDALNLKNRIIEEKARESKYIQEYGITENQYKKLREAEIFRENNSSFRIVLF